MHGFAYRNSGDYDHSEDGGTTWSHVGGGTGRALAAAFRSMDLALAASSNGQILRTGDGGKTWQSIAVPNGLKNVVFVDDNVALALAEQATLLRSTDAGRSWTVVKVAGLGDANRLQASSDGRRVWMFDTSARIFLSEDGGLTWKQQDLGRMTPALARTRFDASFFRDVQTGWLVDSLGRLWVTDSGGQ